MERENLRRQNSGPQRPPRIYLGQKKRRRPPRILWLLLGLALAAGLVFLIVKLAHRQGGGEDAESAPASSSILEFLSTPAPSPQESSSQPPFAAGEPTAPDSEPLKLDSMMVVDGMGYEYYAFSEETANQYILAVDAAGKALAGTATVYHMLVPTSIDVLLPGSYLTRYQVETSDQRKAIDSYIYPSINAMNPDIRTVPLFDPLQARAAEYIYFQTDRTWTQLGAYYAYVEFCKAKGIEALGLDQFEKKEYSGFMGGFSSEAGEESLFADTVEAYIPGGNTSLSFTSSDGESNESWQVISDGSEYDSSLLYLIFAAGDQPYKVLENKDITDGSACVVVQDSYGNFLTPFLTQHYQQVYVVDYRNYEGNVPQLVSETGASDVIILNDLPATSSAGEVSSLRGLF